MKQFKCLVCGYIHSGEEPPERCPVCKVGREKFVEIQAGSGQSEPAPRSAEKLSPSPSSMARKFRCVVCGYIHESDEPPERCPVCKAPREKFAPYFPEENENGIVHGNLFDVLETAHEATKKITHLKTDEMVFETYYFLPGQIIDYHKHPAGDQIFVVMQGCGEFFFNYGSETSARIKAGDYILAPKNVWHKIVNTGANILVMTQVMARNAGMILKSTR